MHVTRRGFVGIAAGAAASLAVPRAAWALGAAAAGRRWYRGMIHAHTCWSDGRALPEQAVAAYKNGGYDFFSITDHNRIGADADRWIEVAPLSGGWPPKTIEPSVFEAFKAAFPDAQWRTTQDGKTEVRMGTMAEMAARFNEPGRFLFLPGCEVTTAIGDASGGRRDLHMNYVGIDEVVPRARKAGLIEWISARSLADVLRETKGQVDALAAAKGNPPHIFVVNHPHWRFYDVWAEDLVANPGVRYFEVCNSGSDFPPPEGMPRDGLDNDRLWDVVNAIRCRRGEPLLYGIATEDSHWYPGSGTSHAPVVFGDAWIGVRADELSAAALFAAMDRGDFYAASGIDLEDVRFDSLHGTLSVSVPAKPGVAYSVKFVTTKRGASLDPVRFVGIPESGARPARRLPVYSDEVGAVAKTVAGRPGEAVRASYALADDDLYVRARVESDEPSAYPDAAERMHPSVKTAWTQPYRREDGRVARYVRDVSAKGGRR